MDAEGILKDENAQPVWAGRVLSLIKQSLF